MSNQHTYQELRDVIVDLLLKRIPVHDQPYQWTNLKTCVAQVLASRETATPGAQVAFPSLHPYDTELVRDVFWDLFRQGFITLGMNDSNDEWPFFRLSHFGELALNTQSPYRFHDTNSFINLVRKEVPDISPEAVIYLEEATSAFYTGCLLASSVMLGVAAEAEFLRASEVAARNPTYGKTFTAVTQRHIIRQKIAKFQDCLKRLSSVLPREATEDLETNFLAIQSVLRIARNDAGHPTGAAPHREQVYVYLQLFIPFARQLMRLRRALS